MIRTSLKRSRLSPGTRGLRPGSIFQRRATTRRDPTDDVWSKVIRLRDPSCRLQFTCRGNRTVEAAHVFGRGKFSTRWEEDCGIGSCWACHRWADEHKTELEARARHLLGEARYTRLLVRSQLSMKEAGVIPLVERAKLRMRLKELKEAS